MSIKAFIHCKSCSQAGLQDHLVIGLSDPNTLMVHCETCDQDVGLFGLAEAIPMRCDHCGEEVGPDHVH